MYTIRTTRRWAALTVLLTVGTTGCAGPSPAAVTNPGDVPTYRGNSARTGEMAGPGPAGSAPTIAWQFEADGAFSNSPIVVDGTVFTASGEGRVHALALRTGEERWTIDLESPVSASPLLVDDLLVVGDEGGLVHALALADGAPAWTTSTDGAITGSPAAVGPDLVLATMGTRAYRLDGATGETIWSTDVRGATARSVAVGEDAAYIGVGGELVALDLHDGAARWRTRVAATGDVGTPTVASELVYASTGIGGDPEDYGIVAIEVATGTIRWAYEGADRAVIYTPAVVGGRAYVLGKDRRVVAMDAATGTELWTTSFDNDLQALPALVGDTVYVAANDGPVAALDAVTGERRWSVDIDGTPFAPTVADGYVFVGTDIGRLYAIGP